MQALLQSSNTFREIEFTVDRMITDDVTPLLLHFTGRLKELPKLKRDSIQAPVIISLRAMHDSKVFEMVNNSTSNLMSSKEVIPRLVKGAEGFIGRTGFIDFILSSGFFKGLLGSPVVECLKLSQFSLGRLNLKALIQEDGRRLWDLSISCPNLSSLTLWLDPLQAEDGGEELELKIPEGLDLVEGLTNLDVISFGYQLPWKRMMS